MTPEARSINSARVHRIWNEERKTNTAIQKLEEQFGDRPMKGFPANDHMRMAENLVAV